MALVVGAAIPAMGMGAAIGLQDDRLAVQPANLVADRIAMLQSTGTKVSRIDLFWATAAPTVPTTPTDPNDPAYVWEWADAVLGGLVGAGIQPIVTVWNAPAWATGGRTQGIRGVVWNSLSPTNPQAFADFMQALATRYNGQTVIPGWGQVKVTFFEIWNEPNLQIYLYPQYVGRRAVSPSAYVKMANLATPAIKAVNPGAVVISGVTGPKGKSDTSGRGTLDWISDLKTAGLKAGSHYSQHIYPASAPATVNRAVPSWSTLNRVIAAVNTLPGGRAKKIYITEASYTTAWTPYRSVMVTPAKQAAFMKQIFTLPIIKTSRIPLVVWFQLQDNRDWPGGLLTDAGAAKPSLAVFKSLVTRNPPKGNLIP
ncbi:MAG: hypothetical protein EXQ74_01365 [Thermoleophilia bacterium]|nr:hypothetical protein [Thermoleophilia bacterium]